MLRSMVQGDFTAIGHVAFETGFFGASAERYFPDERLFADLWIGPYFEARNSLGFVVGNAGRVQGYVLGLPDSGSFGPALKARLWRRVLPGLLSGRYHRPWAAWPYLRRLLKSPAPHAPQHDYPAHLHINLLPAARGQGLGGQLLRRYLDALRERGVPGVQLSTTEENTAALALYGRCGFQVWARRELPLWTPWLGRPAVHVVMVRTLAHEHEKARP